MIIHLSLEALKTACLALRCYTMWLEGMIENETTHESMKREFRQMIKKNEDALEEFYKESPELKI